MAHVYEKQTKDTVDFPMYTLGFLGIIMTRLKHYGLIGGQPDKDVTEVPTTLVLPLVSKKYPYCHDGISLICKTLKRRGFDCTMKSYKTSTKDDGSTAYTYEFQISIKK